MAFVWDPVIFLNLIFCIVIVILGLVIYRRSGEKLPLFIAIAFGLFGISHASNLAGLVLTLPLIIIRGAAYLLVIWALYLYLKSIVQKEAKKS